MAGFFEEVQRRKVYRVAVAYVIAAGGIIQLASAAFPAWELPNWALRLVIVLLLIGFPIALILAWAYDVTPSGIQATPPTATSSLTGRRRNLLFLAATGIVVSLGAGFFILPHAIAHKVDKSIAVLPFENLSDDKENAYFADGVQDDLLTNLSKIGDLKVISRTSVMPYRGQGKNIKEIGKALGVATILEGSVRRDGKKVRINVQLIDAGTDQHLWAQDYDGDLSDVFKVQTEFAEKIARALQATLSPGEKAQLEGEPTQDPAARMAYQDAHSLMSDYEDPQRLRQAATKYEEALRADPKFALAMANYSHLESWIYHTFEHTTDHRDRARTLARQALAISPSLPEAHLAQGFVDYYVDSDFDAAEQQFEIARSGLPNQPEVYLALGAIQRRKGKWKESNKSLEHAVALNPNDSWTMHNLALNYEMQRNYDEANSMIDRAISASPGNPSPYEVKLKLLIEAKGDLESAQRLVDQFNGSPRPEIQQKVAIACVNILILRRKFQEALEKAEQIPDPSLATDPGDYCAKYLAIGRCQSALKDEAGAREAFVKARDAAQLQLGKDPQDASSHANLASTEALLGRREEALSQIAQARNLLPETKDAFNGPDITETEAEIHATLGDASQAVAILDGLLRRPSPVTVTMLKINPVWDPIRNDPGFQKLISGRETKA